VTPLSTDPAEAFSPTQKLHCILDIYTFDAIITVRYPSNIPQSQTVIPFYFTPNVPKENSPEIFQWRGPPVQTVWGIHSFIFEESKVTPGGTTFRQTEDLSGALSFLMHPALMGKGIKEKFEGFNADLKKKAESVAAAAAAEGE
jgi:hypothetical protein